MLYCICINSCQTPQETQTVCTGNDSVSLDQVNNAHKSIGKCFVEDHVRPVDIEGIKLDLALLESQMNNVVNCGLAAKFNCIVNKMQNKQSYVENTIMTQEAEINKFKTGKLNFSFKTSILRANIV